MVGGVGIRPLDRPLPSPAPTPTHTPLLLASEMKQTFLSSNLASLLTFEEQQPDRIFGYSLMCNKHLKHIYQ